MDGFGFAQEPVEVFVEVDAVLPGDGDVQALFGRRGRAAEKFFPFDIDRHTISTNAGDRRMFYRLHIVPSTVKAFIERVVGQFEFL